MLPGVVDPENPPHPGPSLAVRRRPPGREDRRRVRVAGRRPPAAARVLDRRGHQGAAVVVDDHRVVPCAQADPVEEQLGQPGATPWVGGRVAGVGPLREPASTVGRGAHLVPPPFEPGLGQGFGLGLKLVVDSGRHLDPRQEGEREAQDAEDEHRDDRDDEGRSTLAEPGRVHCGLHQERFRSVTSVWSVRLTVCPAITCCAWTEMPIRPMLSAWDWLDSGSPKAMLHGLGWPAHGPKFARG